MKRLAFLPALFVFAAGISSCDKNEVAPAASPDATVSADASASALASSTGLTQGKIVTSSTSGTYPYQVRENNVLVNKTGTFTSALRITSFVVKNGMITAIGTLSATPTSGPASPYGPVAVEIPLQLSQISSSCAGARVTYGTQTVRLNNTAIGVNPILNVSPSQSNKNLLGNLVCSLGKILANPSAKDTGGVVAHLNKIISVIGS